LNRGFASSSPIYQCAPVGGNSAQKAVVRQFPSGRPLLNCFDFGREGRLY
jgi:hypothetical protein